HASTTPITYYNSSLWIINSPKKIRQLYQTLFFYFYFFFFSLFTFRKQILSCAWYFCWVKCRKQSSRNRGSTRLGVPIFLKHPFSAPEFGE
ncbi:unnamed protein product, partial [Prunus brigantina]